MPERYLPERYLPQRHTNITLRTLAVLLAALFLFGCADKSDNTFPDITGTVEAKEVDINTKIPGRVVKILVKEGQQVKAGEVLVRIEDKDLKAKADQLKAQMEAAKASIQKAQVAAKLAGESSAAAVQQATATLEKAKANAALKRKTYERVKALFEADAAPQQKLDEAETDLKAAEAEVQYLEGKLAEAQANQLNLPLREADVAAAKAQYNQAAAALGEVNINLAETVIKAPGSGTVTALNIEEGEMVSSGTPLLTVTDFSDNWVNVKVDQTRVAEIQMHQKAAITLLNAPAQKFTGEVININKKPEFATTRATNDRGEKDIVAYNVKIRLNSPDLQPGMQVKVDFK